MADTATSQEVVVAGTVLPLSQRARDAFDSESLRLLAAKYGPACKPWQLLALAELSARYELDPWANEVWLANMSGRDGSTGTLAMLVGRDGYLKVAKRDRAFVRCAGQAVYEKDHFEAEYVDEETGWRVEHKITKLGKDRGELLGGWATLVRRGLPTEFFFADLRQFGKAPEKSAWKYTDAMIVKCSQSYLLRTTYNVSGAVPHDEVSVGFSVEGTAVEVPARRPVGQELPDAIMGLFRRAQRLDPLSWRLADVEPRVFGAEGEVLEDELRRVRLELERWLTEADPDFKPDTDAVEVNATVEVRHVEIPEAPEAGFVDPETGEVRRARVGTVNVGAPASEGAEAATERYLADEQWRADVDRALGRVLDLEATLGDADDAEAEGIRGDLERAEADVIALGVPRGWMPPPSAPGEGF